MKTVSKLLSMSDRSLDPNKKCGHPGVRELKDVTYSIMECNFTYGDIEDLMYGGRSKVCPLVKQFLHPDVVAREKWLSQLGSGGK